MKLIIASILFMITFSNWGQLTSDNQAKVDSIQHVIKSANSDTTKIKAWLAWDQIISTVNLRLSEDLNQKVDSLSSFNLKNNISKKAQLPFLKYKAIALKNFGSICDRERNHHKAIRFTKKALKTFEKLGNAKEVANAYGAIADQHFRLGNFDKASEYYLLSQSSYLKIGNKAAAAKSLLNIGRVYSIQGNNAKAIECFTEGLSTFEELDDKPSINKAFTNIGIIYAQQEDYPKALIYFEKSLDIQKELKDVQGTGNSLNNIGNIYMRQNDFDKAMEFYTNSLSLLEVNGYLSSMAQPLNNIGSFYQNKGEYEKALEYYYKCLEIHQEIDDKFGMSQSLITLGGFYKEQENYQKAIEYSERSLKISLEIGALNLTNKATQNLYLVYKELGSHEQSLKMHELFVSSRDSIDREENKQEVIRQEYKYEYEKQAAADQAREAEADKVQAALLEAEQSKNERLKLQEYILFGGLAIAILFAGFIFNRFRVISKQKTIILDQKKQVDQSFEHLEEKNKEIMDSINYAKRIQNAILPPDKLVKQHLNKSFILYKPKDIVAGDFYWMEYRDGKVLFAAADCTGHGVPGAMVSVICNNGLNRSVREYGLTNPGLILDKTREIVIEEFEKSEEDVKDGMDIALCSLEGKILKYAGANNPLWIVRNGEVLETKANKQPIAKFDNQIAYTAHTIELKAEDSIYLFSDGYVDQFGGERGKKFKAKAFRSLLLSIQDKSMEEQKTIIDSTFEKWRGSLEQIDDVCVLGVKV